MSIYKSPEEMYIARANRCMREANRHYAQAKNGGGGFHYGKAKSYYVQAANNRQRAEQARASGATFRKGK